MEPRTAFVTGGTGFVGRNVVDELVAGGWTVHALHREGSELHGLTDLPIHLVPGDVLDVASLQSAIPEGVDAVFHVAANTSMWSRMKEIQTRVNVEGTRNVVRTALEKGAGSLIYTSSWNAYRLRSGPMTEELVQEGSKSPINYDRTKARAEEVVREAVRDGLNGVIINPAHVIGRHDRRNWSRMIRLVQEGNLPGIPSGSGTFCHATEVARAHVAAVDRGRAGENYLLSGADASFLEVLGLVGELTGCKVPSRPLPAFVLRLVGRLKVAAALFTGVEPDVTPEIAEMVTCHPRVASTKAEDELGYRTVPLRDMIEDCFQWMEEEGLLDRSA